MQARAIMDLPSHSSGSEFGEGSASGSLEARFQAETCDAGLSNSSLKGSLGSVHEEAAAQLVPDSGGSTRAAGDSTPSITPVGGASSPLAGGSPESHGELPRGRAPAGADASPEKEQRQLTAQRQQQQQATAAPAE